MDSSLDSTLEQLQLQQAKEQPPRRLRPLTTEGLYIRLNDSEEREQGSQSLSVEIHGAKSTLLLNLNSNDYLSLADCPLIFSKENTTTPLRGSTSSRLLVGDRPLFHTFEKQLAKSLQHEAALLFNSGYHANTGILPAIAQPDMVVLADKFIHASMIDGIRLSNLPFERFRHNDLRHLTRLIDRHTPSAQYIVIMVESLYSMDGDFAPLGELVALKKKYPKILLYVDEAHALGVCGKNGLGYAEECGVLSSIDLLVGTFGKALCGMGAYVACSSIVRSHLINKCRSLIFSTMLPEAVIEQCYKHYLSLPYLGARREKLSSLALKLRRAVEKMGLNMPSQSHIIPLICRSAQEARSLSQRLEETGFYARPVCPPTVPKGTERVRISLCSEIPPQEIDRLIKTLEQFFLCSNN